MLTKPVKSIYNEITNWAVNPKNYFSYIVFDEGKKKGTLCGGCLFVCLK